MTGELVKLPKWSQPLGRIIGRLAAQPLPADQTAILIRLATDPRMEQVWKELTRRDRGSGGFLHPARPPVHAPVRGSDEVQNAALAETLHFAFCAARDRMRVTKAKQVSATKAEIFADAETLRRIAFESVGSYDPAAVAEAKTLHRAAERKEAEAAAIRPLHDPLMVKKHRGDPVARGVQIVLTAFLLDRFGERLDRTAATLAAVALGLSGRSGRSSRSAFSRQKSS